VIILFLIWGLFLSFSSLSWAWSGKVVGVADGDTIRILSDGKQVKIRLYGIDCPERGQAFSRKAKQFTSKMVYGKVVEVEPVDVDRYGRTVALVRVNGALLNEALVKEGLAWVYPKYCSRPICFTWYQLEAEAHDNKHGLWTDSNPIPPWEFRRKRRSE
jgi:endonuclease YncB( thermonuclease family)